MFVVQMSNPIAFHLGYDLRLPGFREDQTITDAQIVVYTNRAAYDINSHILSNFSIVPVLIQILAPAILIVSRNNPFQYYIITNGYLQFVPGPDGILVIGTVWYVDFLPMSFQNLNTAISYGQSNFPTIIGTLDTIYGPNPSGGGNQNALIECLFLNQKCCNPRRSFK